MSAARMILVFVCGLLGLIAVYLLLAGPAEPLEIELRPISDDAAGLPEPAVIPVVADANTCQDAAQSMRLFYAPDTSAMSGESEARLHISGVVYAADALTPLSGALVEVWRADAERMDNPRPDVIFRGQFLTDADGRYEFTTMRPVRPDTPYLNIRVSYQDQCPLVIQLRIATAPQQNKTLTKTVAVPSFRSTNPLYAQKNVTGPVLHGPVDIILPVPPPQY